MKVLFLQNLIIRFYFIYIEDDMTKDGATAAERTYPWRRLSIPDETIPSSTSPTNDPSCSGQTSSHPTDPHLHSSPLTSANFGSTYQKSPEYMGEYATTTKPEEHQSRPHIRDLFTRSPDEKQENDTETAPDDSTTRL